MTPAPCNIDGQEKLPHSLIHQCDHKLEQEQKCQEEVAFAFFSKLQEHCIRCFHCHSFRLHLGLYVTSLLCWCCCKFHYTEVDDETAQLFPTSVCFFFYVKLLQLYVTRQSPLDDLIFGHTRSHAQQEELDFLVFKYTVRSPGICMHLYQINSYALNLAIVEPFFYSYLYFRFRFQKIVHFSSILLQHTGYSFSWKMWNRSFLPQYF